MKEPLRGRKTTIIEGFIEDGNTVNQEIFDEILSDDYDFIITDMYTTEVTINGYKCQATLYSSIGENGTIPLYLLNSNVSSGSNINDCRIRVKRGNHLRILIRNTKVAPGVDQTFGFRGYPDIPLRMREQLYGGNQYGRDGQIVEKEA